MQMTNLGLDGVVRDDVLALRSDSFQAAMLPRAVMVAGLMGYSREHPTGYQPPPSGGSIR